jgi:DNA-binding response OmpR family regulator
VNPSVLLVADEPDEPDIVDGVAVGLRAEGLRVLAVVGPGSLRRNALTSDADVIVLDVHRSGSAGLDRLLLLRRHQDRPVVLLAAHDDATVVRALRLGASDVVRLPVAAAELALRVQAAHRNAARPPAPRRHVAGPLVVDGTARSAAVDGEAVPLTSRELDLLVHLMERPEVACTRDEILRAVWGSTSAWQTPATVTEHVRRVRAKLEAVGVDAGITSLRGTGYRYDGARALSYPAGRGRARPAPPRRDC